MGTPQRQILVTGATGFVGRHIVRALVEKGMRVRALAHTPGREHVVVGQDVEVVHASVSDAAGLKSAMDGVDGVVHLVAIIREKGEQTFDSVNHLGTASVVEAAREASVRRYVQMSAIGAIDDPGLAYLQSKWRGEQAVVQSGIPYTILRGSILFGEGDEFVNMLAGLVKALPLVPIAGSGGSMFQPLHVQDVARCLAEALALDELASQTVEIGGPDHLTYDQIIDTIIATFGRKRWKAHLPLRLMRIVVGLMEKTLTRPPATLHQLDMLAIDNVAELGVVERAFGFTPRPLEGNIDYIRQISLADGLKMLLGFMPRRIRDH